MGQVLELKTGIIYGPVNSRRLGRSLGINLSPTQAKLCPFDCLYCHYGHTRVHTADIAQYREMFPTPDQVAAAVRDALAQGADPAYVTFSGNGEPTTHPGFPQVVEAVKPAVRELAPQAKLAILSNSSMVLLPEVVAALDKLDVRIMKLDAGNARTFDWINRPAPGVDFERIVDGLSQLREITIQTLVAATAEHDSSMPADVADWIGCLKRIRPIAVQIYTCDRHPAAEDLKKIPRERLNHIAATAARELGIPVRAY